MRSGNSLLLALVLITATVATGGCATPCTSESCQADAKISADVRAKLKEHRELAAPNSVYVQTRGGVVYLTGQVVTDLQRETAESVAASVPGVVQVVNSIALSFGAR